MKNLAQMCLAMALSGLLLSSHAAHAVQTNITLNGGKLVLSQTDQQMLKASQMVMQRDFNGALGLYNNIISVEPTHAQAYIQRSVVYRELGDLPASESDAKTAVKLTEAQLRQQPQNARLYHQRGMGYRLLKEFAKAKENIQYAIRLSANNRESWQQDIQAIELEEKMY